jgi:hypothetical protein
VRELLPAALARAPRVVHLDLHTGLGRRATYRLLPPSDPPPAPDQLAWLAHTFDPAALDTLGARGVAYHARGDFGNWCARTFDARAVPYLYLCAEFGTYPVLNVLDALRRENQAHHWAAPDAPATLRARALLREAFVPASPSWRTRCLNRALDLVARALDALARDRNPPPNTP